MTAVGRFCIRILGMIGNRVVGSDFLEVAGVMYANGQGVAQDYAEALKWTRKAEELRGTGVRNSLALR